MAKDPAVQVGDLSPQLVPFSFFWLYHPLAIPGLIRRHNLHKYAPGDLEISLYFCHEKSTSKSFYHKSFDLPSLIFSYESNPVGA